MTALGDHHPSNAIVCLNPLGSVTSNAPLPTECHAAPPRDRYFIGSPPCVCKLKLSSKTLLS
jgi:hypothetical protein